jgi:hypothetical protein
LGVILSNILKTSYKVLDFYDTEKFRGKYKCTQSISINGKEYIAEGFHIEKKSAKSKRKISKSKESLQ